MKKIKYQFDFLTGKDGAPSPQIVASHINKRGEEGWILADYLPMVLEQNFQTVEGVQLIFYRPENEIIIAKPLQNFSG